MSGDLAIFDPNNIDAMARYSRQICDSKLFPVKTPEQAFGMVQIALAENIPPVKVFEKYYLIPDRAGNVVPALKSIWVMAEARRQGMRFDWKPVSNPRLEVHLVATEPEGSSIEIKLDWKTLSAAGKTAGNAWKTDSDQMLRYRAAVQAVKAIMPEVIAGVPVDVDVEDRFPIRAQVVQQMPAALEAAMEAEVVPQVVEEEDDRPVVESEVEEAPKEPEVVMEAVVATPEVEEEVKEPEVVVNPEKLRLASPSSKEEVGKRIKMAGLTPVHARARWQEVLGKTAQWGELTEGDMDTLLKINWK